MWHVFVPLFAGLAFALHFGQPTDGISVTTDATSYAPGDPIQVTILNSGPDRVVRGGTDCDDLWPLALEQHAADDSWQVVPAPSHQCIGIAAALLGPGETQTMTVSLTLDPGSYHLVYAFDDVDNGTQDMSISDPFDITSDPAS